MSAKHEVHKSKIAMPTVDAKPFPYFFDIDHVALVCIDMQRDFCQPGEFANSLGDNVKNLQPCIPVIAKLQAAFRKLELPIIHTKECHKPDLSDLPTPKRYRGNPKVKIGDMGPMGRILIDGEPGSDFIAELAPRQVGTRHLQAGQGHILQHQFRRLSEASENHQPGDHRGDDRSLRANDHALCERPRLRLPPGRGRYR